MHVTFQSRGLRKFPITDVTTKRPFTSVRAHVARQINRSHKLLVADTAAHLLTGVYQHVCFQVRRLRKFLLTVITTVRLVACVDPHVDGQVGQKPTFLMTDVTAVRVLIIVNAHVTC